MKLLFLSKRRPMGKDLVASPYGRFFHLPRILAERGHDVSIVLLDYENGAELEFTEHGMRWISAPMRGYIRAIRSEVVRMSPDWLIGFSDTYFGILAVQFARKYGVRACVDAYDNYESYIAWARPLHWLWRRALRRADLLTAAGPALAELMLRGEGGEKAAVVPMASDPIGFEPKDKQACRRRLQLPVDYPLVGYCGSMHRSRGVEVLFDAIPLVLSRRPEVRFIHSGRTWQDVQLPQTIESLGFIDDEKVPYLLNSMDALVVTNRASSFGNYSYPVKLYEAMSCQVPVVATRTLATEWILDGHRSSLVQPSDPQELGHAILRALEEKEVNYGSVPTWNTSCELFEKALLSH
jgi:glycosyltransferase involved in cell wall biosynthesis